jgi:hypothetical protein
MSRKKKLVKLVKRAIPQEAAGTIDDNLLGYIKLLIEMDLEETYMAHKDKK